MINRKRLPLIIVLALLIVLGLGVYFVVHNNIHHEQNSASISSVATPKMAVKRNKILIIYYSNSGNTQNAAERIQKQTKSHIVEMSITPTYPNNYSKLTSVVKKQFDNNTRPKINNVPNLAKYNIILLGFPTWFHRPPMLINTFFETTNLRGKTVIPFTTSADSPISDSTPYLKRMARGTGVKLQEGFRANNISVINKYVKRHKLV